MKCFTRFLACLSVFGCLATQTVSAANPSPPTAAPQSAATQPAVADVQLTRGELRGQIVDRQGQPRADRVVRLVSGGQVLAQSTTDANGAFALKADKGGVCVLSDQESAVVVRVWTEKAAPPAAKKSILMVSDRELARANLGNGNDWLIGAGVIATATTAVIVTSFEDDEDSGS